MAGLKGLAVVTAFGLGALAAIGCALAALFELQGFGGPRDSDPRPGYLLALALGFLASLGVPWLLWRRLFPGSAPGWAVAAAVAAGVAALLILGMSR